jgi:hypothetical protein
VKSLDLETTCTSALEPGLVEIVLGDVMPLVVLGSRLGALNNPWTRRRRLELYTADTLLEMNQKHCAAHELRSSNLIVLIV